MFRMISALIMGAAICGMHYTGMAAAVFTPAHSSFIHAMKVIDPYLLALYVSIATGNILTIALIVSIYKQFMFSATQRDLNSKNIALQEQNRQIQEANRLKSEFLANMSHELRTPLTGIIGFTELMYHGKVGPVSPRHKEYLGDILSSAHHLLQLINDILDLAKVESGKIEFYPEKISINKVITEVCDILRTLIAKKRIHLDVNIDPQIDELFLDPAKLKQVIYNYISNAIKFTEDHGKVSLKITPEDEDNFRIEVQDNGIGIQEKDLNRLFIEFQQLDATIAKKYQGTGLGLALTKCIVEAQGGKVGVYSVLGQGSTFYAILPRVSFFVPDSTPEDCLASEKLRMLNAPTVLVIEDNVKDRQFIINTLIAGGYHVETAATGKEALKLCQSRVYDAISLDLILPDIDGWNILQEIRKKGPNKETPVIVVTVIAEKASGLVFQIHDFLIKPINAKTLLNSLQKIHISPKNTEIVLVVDDSMKDLEFIKILLNELKFNVTCIKNPQEGLLFAQKNNPAAIILDLLMPSMDGFEFLYQLRLTEKGQKIPVIIWTAKTLSPQERKQLQILAQGIVLKSGKSTDDLLSEFRESLKWLTRPF